MITHKTFTKEELIDVTGWHDDTTRTFLNALHRERAVHVIGWLPDTLGRDAYPIYTIGAGTDKPRAKLTPAERSRRYRQRQAKLALDRRLSMCI